MTRLARLVVRIPPELRGKIAKVSALVTEETGVREHRSTIVRGLLLAGLATLDKSESIATFFEGLHIPRGRKKRDP